MRLRFRNVQTQTRIKNRIKGLLHNYGISIPIQYSKNSRWSYNFIAWLESVQLNTDAGCFVLQNLVDQLKENRQHLKNILLQLRKESRNDNI